MLNPSFDDDKETKMQTKQGTNELFKCMMFKVSIKGTGRIRSQGRSQEWISKAK